ncbi:uncharacterized protein PHACADRAFT_94695, partial [Phanerochaete carnosa HHB-10118-sp]
KKPVPFDVFLRFWEQLPGELHNYIHLILENSDDKNTASALSLISQVWCRHFRPRLFALLLLAGEEDCRILFRIVRSPLSAWLKEHITELRFDHHHLHDHRLWIALVSVLPACRRIEHNFKDDPGRISYSAALKSSLRSITSLTLVNCSFPSPQILLRILADITDLEAVTLVDVKWPDDRLTTAAGTANNVCTGAFSHVRSVTMRRCTNNLVVPAWILAAASTRHSFTRRQPAGLAVPAETRAIIQLIQVFLGDGTISSSEFNTKQATPGEFELSPYQAAVLI